MTMLVIVFFCFMNPIFILTVSFYESLSVVVILIFPFLLSFSVPAVVIMKISFPFLFSEGVCSFDVALFAFI